MTDNRPLDARECESLLAIFQNTDDYKSKPEFLQKVMSKFPPFVAYLHLGRECAVVGYGETGPTVPVEINIVYLTNGGYSMEDEIVYGINQKELMPIWIKGSVADGLRSGEMAGEMGLIDNQDSYTTVRDLYKEHKDGI